MTDRPDPFAAARSAEHDAPRGTELPLPCDVTAHATLTAFLRASKESRAAAARAAGLARSMLRYLLPALFEEWLRAGSMPPAPYVARNAAGESCRLVLHDQSAIVPVDGRYLDRLTRTLGEELTSRLCTHQTAYDFNQVTLAQPAVREKVRAALMESELTAEELAALLVVRVDRRLKPSFLHQLVETIGPARLARVLPALEPVVEVECQP